MGNNVVPFMSYFAPDASNPSAKLEHQEFQKARADQMQSFYEEKHNVIVPRLPNPKRGIVVALIICFVLAIVFNIIDANKKEVLLLPWNPVLWNFLSMVIKFALVV